MKSKKSNIAEYILYLWQIEDYLRAFPQQADANPELKEIAEMMHSEGIVESGHLQLAENALSELEDLSRELEDEDATYRAAAMALHPQLVLLKVKTDDPTMSDMRACFVLLYQITLLRLKKQEISAQTDATVRQVTSLVRFLCRVYADAE